MEISFITISEVTKFFIFFFFLKGASLLVHFFQKIKKRKKGKMKQLLYKEYIK